MTETKNPWYAIRTFNCQEQKVSRFLTEKGFLHFIPMKVTLIPSKADEEPKQVQVPAIHNLLFVQIPDNEQQLLQTLKECMVPVSVFRHPVSYKYSPIPDSEIVELRMLCDPEYETSVFLTEGEADAMVGKEVREW